MDSTRRDSGLEDIRIPHCAAPLELCADPIKVLAKARPAANIMRSLAISSSIGTNSLFFNSILVFKVLRHCLGKNKV